MASLSRSEARPRAQNLAMRAFAARGLMWSAERLWPAACAPCRPGASCFAGEARGTGFQQKGLSHGANSGSASAGGSKKGAFRQQVW